MAAVLPATLLEARAAILSDKRVRDGFLSAGTEDHKSFEGLLFSTMTLLSSARFASGLESRDEGDGNDEESKLLLGPIFRERLPSKFKFKRDALCVNIVSPASQATLLRLINVHLDSLEDIECHRPEQIKILADVLRQPGCGRRLVAGDFNDIGPQDKGLLEKNKLVDAWIKLYGTTGSDGNTWSVGVLWGDGLKPGRLDKAAMVGLEAKETEVLLPGSISVPKPGGKEDEIPLSDHCGLRCVFNI